MMPKVPVLALIPLVVFAGLAGLFMTGMSREDPDSLPSTFEGRPAPTIDASMTLNDYPAWSDADMRKPGVKIVNVFASWCAPCRAEHPTLVELAQSGILIYGINRRDTADDAQAFLEELGNPYAGILTDPQGRQTIEWGVYGVPETFVIDGEGIIRLRVAGPVTQRVYSERVKPVIAAAR